MTDCKRLQELTLTELWELFPIVLSPYNPQWPEWAKEEIDTLSGLLSAYTPIISHIGSTAIPNIQAKPIIDILVEISPDIDWQLIKNEMELAGYICMSVTDTRMTFNKGYTPRGYAEKVFHIHIHVIADNDEIYFRDYLLTHTDVAREYETLKLGLLPKYRNNRDGYTEAKTDFVKRITDLAKAHSGKKK